MADRELSKLLRFRRLLKLSDSDRPALTILRARDFLAEYPEHGQGWLCLGNALTEAGRYEEAEEAFTQALELRPKQTRRIVFADFGHHFLERGDCDRAALWYERSIEADPDDSGGYIYLGALFARQGRLGEAEDRFRAATRCSKGCIDEAYLNLGHMLKVQERFQEAAEYHREAIRLDPEYLKAKRALRDVESCLKFLQPVPPVLRSSRNRLDFVTDSVIPTSRSMRGRFQRLRAIANGNRTAFTMLRARAFVAKYPKYGAAWHILGCALVDLARYDEAEEALTRALELCPVEMLRFPLSRLGHLFLFQFDLDRATTWFQRAVEADPDHAGARVFLGEVLAKQGRFAEAEECQRAAALRYKGDVSVAYLNLGLVLRAQERFLEAAENFRAALRVNPKERRAKRALRDVEACLKTMGEQ